VLEFGFVLDHQSLEVLFQDCVGVKIDMVPDDQHYCLDDESNEVLFCESNIAFKVSIQCDIHHDGVGQHWFITKMILIIFWGR